MNPRYASCAIGMLFVFTAAGAAASHDFVGKFAGPPNRIVGLWGTEATVGPCGGTPATPIRNTLLFHAGGTVVESPRFGPNGVPNVAGVPGIYQRGQALGTWSYDPGRRTYYIHLQFDNYVDNVYHGFSTVDREIALSKEGWIGSGPVRSARYKADGSFMSEVCGQATSARL